MNRLATVALLVAALPGILQAQGDPQVGELLTPLARAMTAAEEQLALHETQAAESRYRSVLLEGWLLLGGLEVVEGDLARALEAYERAAASVADPRRPHTSLALVHLRRGDTDEAVRWLRRIVAMRPDDGKTRRLLAQALVAAGSPQEAVQELEEARAAADGDDPETTFALATGYLRLGKVEEADRLFARIADELPGAETQILIGRTYRDFRHFERARTALETALELDPKVRRGHYYLGTLELLSRGRDRLEPALDRFRRELELAPRDPMTHLYLGMALAESRRFEEALESLEIAARWEPTRLDALRFLGRSHLALDRPQPAVSALRRALELAEERGATPRQLAGIHYPLGTALRRLGAEEEATHHFAAAEETSTDLVEADRDRFTRFLDDATALEPQAGALPPPFEATAVSALDEPRRRDLRRRTETILARAYLNLGILQARNQRYVRAAELFERSEELDPGLPRLQYSLGAARFNAQRFAEAAEALDRALAEDPSNADLQRMLALALLNTESYERAAALLEDDPRRRVDPSLEYAYGLALVRSGGAERGEAVFDRLVSEHAEWPELHVLLGQAHAHQGDYPAARAALERALELDPQVAEAHETLGILLLRQGHLDEAESALRAELDLDENDARSRYHLAVVLDLSQRPDEAADELATVLRDRPDMADARYLLGKIRLAQGDPEAARLHLEAAMTLAPEDANIRYQLGQAYQRLGRVELAGRQFELYRDLKRRERSESP